MRIDSVDPIELNFKMTTWRAGAHVHHLGYVPSDSLLMVVVIFLGAQSDPLMYKGPNTNPVPGRLYLIT